MKDKGGEDGSNFYRPLVPKVTELLELFSSKFKFRSVAAQYTLTTAWGLCIESLRSFVATGGCRQGLNLQISETQDPVREQILPP